MAGFLEVVLLKLSAKSKMDCEVSSKASIWRTCPESTDVLVHQN